jgi:hypothetical protein
LGIAEPEKGGTFASAFGDNGSPTGTGGNGGSDLFVGGSREV